MATLTEVGSIARNVIKYGSISLIILALIPGTIGLIKRIYASLNPPPPAPPTVSYGKLPKLILPEAPNFATPEYKLETISGGLPSMPNIGKVYLVGINRSRLLTLDRMTGRARTVGFSDPPVQMNDRTYKYTNAKLPSEMIFDVISGAIAYKYDWTNNPRIRIHSNSVQIGAEAITEARRFLEKLGTLTEDLARGDGKVVYLIASGSALTPTTAPYEADVVRVDLFRAPKDDMPIVTVGGETSPINVILSSISGDERVLQANFQYSQTVANDHGTYPLKPIDTAWQELQSGGGFIAKRTPDNSVTIRKVSLAYFESSQPQLFLQPVYLFEGDKGFMAYVHAIDSGYVQD